MTASTAQFTGSIADIYDRWLVPLIFSSYAEDLAGRIAKAGPQTVLETCAGTGVLTRAMASRLPESVHVTATDISQPMLDHAAIRLPASGRIAWRQADALALPFPDQAFDAVACQFGAMFFPDRVRGFQEARRVLKPGGRFFFSVWDAIGDNEFADVVTQILATLFPQDPPRFMIRLPHGYYDPRKITSDLDAAGFASISIEPREAVSRGLTTSEIAMAFCQGTPLRSEIEARGTPSLQDATLAVADELARHYGGVSPEGRMKAQIVTASRSA